jgi:hypothetical protein
MLTKLLFYIILIISVSCTNSETIQTSNKNQVLNRSNENFQNEVTKFTKQQEEKLTPQELHEIEVLARPPEIIFSITEMEKDKFLDRLFDKNKREKKDGKRLMEACNYMHPIVRNYAVQLAGKNRGDFNIGQVCDIFDKYFANWKYVNDPASKEYVEYASNSISNNFNGDCDDFAVLMCSSILAIGGEARINYAYNRTSGHAFTEVNIGNTNLKQIKDYLQIRYKTDFAINGRTNKKTGNFWLNLDWQASYPGGPYFDYVEGTTYYIIQNTYRKFRK